MKKCIVVVLLVGIAATAPKQDKKVLETTSKPIQKALVQELAPKDPKKALETTPKQAKKALVQESAPKDPKKSLVQVLEGSGSGSGKNRPVTKVINLLKDMVKQLKKEGEEDEEIYEQMGCWCETNDKKKTQSIADAESKIAELTSAIDEYTATSSQLNTEITNLKEEVANNEKALSEATAMREKELAEFTAEEKENLVTISSLKSAVIALSKHHEGASLLQTPSENTMIANALHRIVHRHADDLVETLTPTQLRSIAKFVSAPNGRYSLVQTPSDDSETVEGYTSPSRSCSKKGVSRRMSRRWSASPTRSTNTPSTPSRGCCRVPRARSLHRARSMAS